MVHFSKYSRRVEEIFLPEDGPTELGANISIADAMGRAGGEGGLPTGVGALGGSRDENGAVGVRGGVEEGTGAGPGGRPTWDSFRSIRIRRGVRRHCTHLSGGSGAIQAAQARQSPHLHAQAAIMRMTHDEPGPGQTYALQARKAIAALREREPSVEIEFRWCPAHKGIPGNEVADGWAKQAANEPDGRRVE